MKKSGFIDSVRVQSPCGEDWAGMAGSDQVRFCSHCAKNVNNLSEMTRKDARKLVLASGGNLCIRYVQHPRTGGPLFAAQFVKIAGRTGLAAGVLGASLAATQPAIAQGSAEPVQVVRASERPGGASARINGTVLDPHGAVVPFAVVSLINKETGEHRVINADAEGSYQFADLPAGTYTLRAEAAGFKTFETSDIKLTDGSLLRTNANLTLPQVSAVVQVGAAEELPKGEMFVTVGLIVSSVSSNPLVAAAMRDDLEEVKVRVAMRERINVRDKSYDGLSPLHAAVQNGNVEIARFLLERGAKVNIRDFEKRTPLMMLDEDATPEMLQLLLSFGAKPKLIDKEGNNALHHAAAKFGFDEELIRSLALSGVNVDAANKEGKTALMIAAEENSTDVVAALLQSGADVNRRTRDGRAAIDIAAGDQIRDALASFGAVRRE